MREDKQMNRPGMGESRPLHARPPFFGGLMSLAQKIIVIVLAALIAAFALFGVLHLQGKRSAGPAPDPAAAASPEGLAKILSYGLLEASPGFAAGLCASPAYEEEALRLYFTCPERNEVLLSLEILDESGRSLGQTGLVSPGQTVEWVSLKSLPASRKVTCHIRSFEPDTLYSRGAFDAAIAIP